MQVWEESMRFVGLSLRPAPLAPALRTRSRGFAVALAALCAVWLAPRPAMCQADEDSIWLTKIAPMLRADLGAAWRFQPSGAEPAFTLNLNAGLYTYPANKPLVLLGEIGYSYTHQHTHTFTAGFGAGAGT